MSARYGGWVLLEKKFHYIPNGPILCYEKVTIALRSLTTFYHRLFATSIGNSVRPPLHPLLAPSTLPEAPGASRPPTWSAYYILPRYQPTIEMRAASATPPRRLQTGGPRNTFPRIQTGHHRLLWTREAGQPPRPALRRGPATATPAAQAREDHCSTVAACHAQTSTSSD